MFADYAMMAGAVSSSPQPANVLKDNIASKRNPNTVRKTQQCSTKLAIWLKENKNETRDIVVIPPIELDIYIGTFCMSIVKPNGDQYEPDSMTSFHRGIDRYLREKDYPHSILTSDVFATSRQILTSYFYICNTHDMT